MLGLFGLVIAYIIIDYTLVAFFRCMCSCLRSREDPNIKRDAKDSFEERYRNSNILGSYKIFNNPDYKHTARIITEIKRKAQQQKPADASMQSLREPV